MQLGIKLVMKINNLVSNLDKEIDSYSKHIASLQIKKEKFSKILDKYPSAEFEKGSIYLDDIWQQISCMHFCYRSTYRSSDIMIKCMMPEKTRVENMRICAKIPDAKIATIQYNFQAPQPRIHSIMIYDFRSLIPENCPKRKQFIFRMRGHILDRIQWQKLAIMPGSYNKDEFETYMMIK